MGFWVPGSMEYCSVNCPMNDDTMDGHVFITDDTLKVTHHKLGQEETMIAVKLCAIISSSLLLIALMVKVLGISLGYKFARQRGRTSNNCATNIAG